jgi:tetratricopeptide (TPR) repeat protein
MNRFNVKNIKLKLVLFSLVCIPIFNGYSQSDSLKLIYEDVKQMDSLRFKALKEYYNINVHSLPDSVLVSLDYHYQLADEKNETRQMFNALNSKAHIYMLKGRLDKSIGLYSQAEALAIQLENPYLQAIITGNLGNIFVKQKKYQKAIQNYSTSLKFFQDQENEGKQSSLLLRLGNVYSEIVNYNLALEYYQKTLLIDSKKEDEDLFTAIINMNIGLSNFEQAFYQEAISSFENALEVLQIKNDKFFIAGCYTSLAKIYRQLNQLDLAYEYAAKSLATSSDLNIESEIVKSLLIIAQIASETSVDEAAKQGEVILARLTPDSDNDIKKETYALLYKCYKTQKKMALSLKMHEIYTIYNYSIQFKKNNSAVAREAVKSYFELKLSESIRKSEKEKATLKITQIKRTFAIAITSALLIFCVIFYFRSKTKSDEAIQAAMLNEIIRLKYSSKQSATNANTFELVREKIEHSINKELNETDWKVLNVLLVDPVITNKEIAEKVFMSVDGIGSSLRRMYAYFDIKESKYKKVSLLLDTIKRSNR